MLSAVDSSGKKVVAWEVEKGQSEFFCPECAKNLVLRKGQVKIHHFAHKIDRDCDFGVGETPLHRMIKYQMYISLQKDLSLKAFDLEYKLENGQRADIMFWPSKGLPVAVELQRSTLSLKDIETRTLGYTNLGIPVLWITVGISPEAGKEFRAKEWQVWLHAMWYGKLFTHAGGQRVSAWSMEKVVRLGEDYYIPGGEGAMDSAPDRTLRRTKTLKLLAELDIVSDMERSFRSEWKQYPRALLWDSARQNRR